MTSHVLRVLASNAALLGAGIGFLLLINGWSRFGRWSRFAVALLAGQALFIVAAPLLLLAGLSVSPLVVLPLVASLLAAGLFRSRRRGPSLPSPSESRALLPTAIVALPLVGIAVAAVVQPLYEVDTMLNWVMKAKVIWANGRQLTGVLDPALFQRPDLNPQSHLEYPLGMNAFLAWSFHWMGEADIRVMHLQLVLLLAGAVGTWWAILRPDVPDLPLAVALAGLVLMPAVVHHLLTAYADVPLAIVWVTGTLLLMRWAAEGERHRLALATLLLAAALSIKQDGVFYDAAIFLAVGGVVLVRERRRLRELCLSAAIVVLTAVPWQVYTAANDLGRHDVRPGLGRMQEQTDRLLPTLEGMLNVASHPRTTLFAVPLALGLAIVCVARRRRAEIVVPFLVCVGLVLAAILLIYWNSAVSLEAVLIPALGRIMMSLIVLAWLLVPLLAFAAVAPNDTYDEWTRTGRGRNVS